MNNFVNSQQADFEVYVYPRKFILIFSFFYIHEIALMKILGSKKKLKNSLAQIFHSVEKLTYLVQITRIYFRFNF